MNFGEVIKVPEKLEHQKKKTLKDKGRKLRRNSQAWEKTRKVGTLMVWWDIENSVSSQFCKCH